MFYITPLIVFVSILILQYVLKETPPRNVLRYIGYRRNVIRIYFARETVQEPIQYAFGKIDTNKYFLDITDCFTNYEHERKYSYGDVHSIGRHLIGPRKTRVTFTFNRLKDTPSFSYHQDKKHFEIHFNRYLDNEFFIVIDPGHGGRNSGARGPTGEIEKNINLAIALQLKQLLEGKEGVNVFLTRERDEDVSLPERRRMARFWDSDVFISIHANGARNKTVNQTEIYYADNRSTRLANIIRDDLQKALNIGRGLVRRRGYSVIRGNSARLGSVLVETMYLSNKTGERYLKDKKYQKIIAESLNSSLKKIINEAK